MKSVVSIFLDHYNAGDIVISKPVPTGLSWVIQPIKRKMDYSASLKMFLEWACSMIFLTLWPAISGPMPHSYYFLSGHVLLFQTCYPNLPQTNLSMKHGHCLINCRLSCSQTHTYPYNFPFSQNSSTVTPNPLAFNHRQPTWD